ncbi:MAG: ABC transporter permease subunit [Spirochaetales bacterium]|jgi:NitT/TauT family transport system permease protein|nr:ABC transporter permease subunit [Spirochaetales bacterium]
MIPSTFPDKFKRGSGFVLGLLLFLAGWKLLSLRLASPILLPPPGAALSGLGGLLGSAVFWKAAGATALRTLAGFGLSFAAALLTAFPGALIPVFGDFLRPLLILLRSTPVLSIILLAMLWFPSGQVPVFVCFLMVYPLAFANMQEGMSRLDPGLVEMAKSFQLNRRDRLRHIWLPSLLPYLLAAAQAGLGMAWKVTIAAEILCQPGLSIGRRIQYAQANLETTQALAWTLAAVVFSGLGELGLLALRKRLNRRGL